MQFKVPQNIDLEDKIVGPLTLIQFVYCLVGGLICYIIYQLFPSSLGLVLLIDIPIALVALALAFLKIQDQPLVHFILAGLQYYSRPKTRFWRRFYHQPIIFNAPMQAKVATVTMPRKKVEKSDLEKLAYVLDTRPLQRSEEKNFGKITQNFEKILQQASSSDQYKKLFAQKGGQGGNVGSKTTTS